MMRYNSKMKKGKKKALKKKEALQEKAVLILYGLCTQMPIVCGCVRTLLTSPIDVT